MKVLILIAMIFCHIIDDYTLQGILASMKQKQWWNDNAPDELYKYDYIVALIMHSFSWSFMIMIAPTIYYLINNSYNNDIIILFILNTITHAIIDDLKANKKKINLIDDQIVHIAQIVCTWIAMILI